MSLIGILVAAAKRDLKAEVIVHSVDQCSDMRLIRSTAVQADQVEQILATEPNLEKIAVILVGPRGQLADVSQRLLATRDSLVVLHVDLEGIDVQIELTNPQLGELIQAVRALLHGDDFEQVRIADFPVNSSTVSSEASPPTFESNPPPLFRASTKWIHSVFRQAISRVNGGHGDVHGFSVTQESLIGQLDSQGNSHREDDSADEQLKAAFDESMQWSKEPLAIASKTMGMRYLEFKLLLLALSPELGNHFQRCIGFLMDDMSRRVGTMSLYCSLLGHAVETRIRVSTFGQLAEWQLFETLPVFPDDPIRLDPFVSEWILGKEDALSDDPLIRKLLRTVSWPGSTLLRRDEEVTQAMQIFRHFGCAEPSWLILGNEPANWRAMLELGSELTGRSLIRVEAKELGGLEKLEIEDAALGIARASMFSNSLVVVDSVSDSGQDASDKIGRFLQTLGQLSIRGVIVADTPAPMVRHLSPASSKLLEKPVLSESSRIAAVTLAGNQAGAYLTSQEALQLAQLYPLDVARLEQASQLVLSRQDRHDYSVSTVRRFSLACRDLSIEGISHIAERIDPVFRIDDVILPKDRADQLFEIVNHIRLASTVLDGWKFGDQLPYGRGVTALFFGPSGTGKTMAAMGIANELGVQLLRVDLSRIVSKYIGETEKNIDRVFRDAQQSHSAILIDEADALLGKRSEVRDSHDRYANIEIAYLLQRMEQYEGLAMLTSNMRQNLDAAFLRRIRFIVSFPKPDALAREKIWRFCLPEASHELAEADFRQLARKIELTGGHIRQMSLRAAFLAASEHTRIRAEHIDQAARAEYAKLGMPAIDLELTLRSVA